ncbi:hypothetical protein GQ457_01G013220 [Hibiscus cannabinus]
MSLNCYAVCVNDDIPHTTTSLTRTLVPMGILNCYVVCVNDDMPHTTTSLTRTLVPMGMSSKPWTSSWFCKSLKELCPIVSLKRPHFTLT